MVVKFWQLICFLVLSIEVVMAQDVDTIKHQELSPITIQSLRDRNEITRLEPIKGTYIYAGKKSEIIQIQNADISITEKTARQLFAKVPGVFVYDMEGSNQINIATRGLDPHRAWEFNLRKDNIIINSDMYAYPASHYSIPMESVEKIELVRGTGALSYGAQFGGMLNYISKSGDPNKTFSFENFSSIGSYNLISSYNAVGGKIGKIQYYTYFSKKSKNGFRDNEHTDYEAEGVKLKINPGKNLEVVLDWARSNYLYKIPGPLTDSMFNANPQQATRARNYFNPIINVPSLTINYTINKKLKLQYCSSALLGKRQSVIFDKPANIADTISLTTHSYANRQVDVDQFNSYSNELRLLSSYSLFAKTHQLSGGIQYLNNSLHRSQLGKGTTGFDYDLTLVDGKWGRDLYFKTQNIAVFIENKFNLSNSLSINVGARIESGESKMSGTISYYPENNIPLNISHKFPLFGGGLNYKFNTQSELYGGFSQAYRPVLFKDIIPSSIYEKVNSDIKDADGYNMELGYRGKWNNFSCDISAFALQYNNRFGTLVTQDSLNNFITYRTNIGNSITKGLELFLQYSFPIADNANITIFTSTALMDGKYTSGNIKVNSINRSIKGNKIESVPELITRNGLSGQYKKLSATLLLSYTDESFADPANTELPNATGSVGLVPAYFLTDFNASYQVSSLLGFKLSINNMFDKSYFTKRPLFYPGPGVWPSDGRNISCSVIFKI